eukprot:CAMPEP_0202692530 /NCGR_PEP_ID=MMETSP1385-20130828/6885_1 /ASSEMBLY_ACC=CAM_ASM_000861 /TAXON_ID=933848 /ORGANISM="Elphidium margaritaceum" /LENGTH=1260 /DNA_ID=CAMNT_0049348073 /DNA_START=54 /DNA_END=3836 /DNA_ORIENTATION=-
MDFFCLLSTFTVVLSILQSSVHAACEEAININTATLSDLTSLPYIGTSRAQSIISFRPICSLLELTDTDSAKKIIGLTETRLNSRWNWYTDQVCEKTCCLADAICNSSSDTSTTAAPLVTSFDWVVGDWSECTVECGGGTQERSVSCTANDGSETVSNAYCLNVNGTQPLNKRVCNTQNCPNYQWQATEWSECGASDDGTQCLRKRSVSCYDIEIGERVRCIDCCDESEVWPTTLACDDAECFGDSDDAANITIDDIHIKIDLQRKLNQQRCHTDMFDERGQFAYNNTFIIRRSCAVTAFIAVTGIAESSVVNASWFELEAELQAITNENVSDEWSSYLSWSAIDAHSGYLTLSMPSDAAVGEYLCHLYYHHAPDSSNLEKDVLAQIRIFVLFNPYSEDTDEYVESLVDRKEYVENEEGLLWRGSYNNYGAMVWQYDQFFFPNLEIAMYVIRRLAYAHRRDLVLVSRQISFGIGYDICHGRWSEPYTEGAPANGYACEEAEDADSKVCREPWYWTGTTDMFDLFRDVLMMADSVQYCQCWVFAAVTTTVGRALGIATRPVTNFQSAHDTDYNRAIDNYFEKVEKVWGGASYYETDGASHDSVWNFHVWNDMFFKRRYDWDDDNDDDGVSDWNAVDATPQEYSYGGNPYLTDYGHGYYQMGPAQLSMVKNNNNTDQCAESLASVNVSDAQRFGCFDQEFVISEVNAQFNAWVRPSTAPSSEPFVFLSSWETDPTNADLTIGQSMSTKRPGDISANCLDAWINDCDNERLDVTDLYKYSEPSGPGIPTDRSNYDITERQRRRLLDENENGVEYSVYTEPSEYYFARTIVAAEPANITAIYPEDDTYALVSLEIDSFFDDEIMVLCTFTATAHAYNGDKLMLSVDDHNTSVIKREERTVDLLGGDSDSCVFNLTYAEYESWIVLNPYAFKLSVIASVYESSNATVDAYKVIVEQLDFFVCIPKYRFADRIVCESGLKWYEPSYNLSYACDAVDGVDLDSVADGFCDERNNVEPCFDGGDCCASSCVYGEVHSCSKSAFNCIDERVTSQFTQNEDCPDPISFVQFMEQLWSNKICVDVQTSIEAQSFVCTDAILIENGTGNACVDRIAGLDENTLYNCSEDTVYVLSQETRDVIKVVADCLSSENRSSVSTSSPSSTVDLSSTTANDISTTATDISTTSNVVIVTQTIATSTQQTDSSSVDSQSGTDEHKSKSWVWILVGVLGALVLAAIAVVIFIRFRKQQEMQGAQGGTYLAMTNQPEDNEA